MALTRTMLKGMGLTEEQISTIIEAHTESTDALKEQREKFKADAEELAGVRKELESLKAKGTDDWQTKYEKAISDFDAYKAEISAKETKSAKQSAYRDLLKAVGVSENRINSVLKVADIDAIELAKDGTIKDADKVSESIKSEWSDFIVQESSKGVQVSHPPVQSGAKNFSADDIKKMSTAEINANWDAIKSSLKNN